MGSHSAPIYKDAKSAKILAFYFKKFSGKDVGDKETSDKRQV
jgi:hypothetical protein